MSRSTIQRGDSCGDTRIASSDGAHGMLLHGILFDVLFSLRTFRSSL